MRFKKPDNGILVVEKVCVHSGLYLPRIKEKAYSSCLCMVLSDSEYRGGIYSIRDKDLYRVSIGETHLFLAREEVLQLEVIPEDNDVVDQYQEYSKYYGLEDGDVVYTSEGIEG